MTEIALATTFVGALSPGAALDAIARAAPDGVVLDDGLAPSMVDAFAAAAVPVLAVEAPCPRPSRWRGAAPELCADDREEARAALDAVEATVTRAGGMGARFVAVKLGAVRALEPEWTRARARFLRGDLDEDDAIPYARRREHAGARPLDVARRALDRLARAAERAGVIVCVRAPRRYIELPTASEWDALAGELRGAPIAPLFDAAHAHLQDVMGFDPLALSLATFGAGAALAYVGDACGPVGALAPGRGLLDLRAIDRALPKTAARAFRPWNGLSPDEAIESFAALRRS